MIRWVLGLIIFLLASNNGAFAESHLNVKQKRENYDSNRLIIQYKDDTSRKKLKLFDVNKRNKLSTQVESIELSKATDIKQVINDLKQRKDILHVEENKTYKLHSLPNDEFYSYQWGLEAIQAPKVWDEQVTHDKGEITVAVIDSGIDKNHEELVGKVLPGYNFVQDNTDVTDVSGHGTAVAGVIAANYNNEKGISGVVGDLNVKILPLRTSDTYGISYLENIIRAIDYAMSEEVDVINLSLGTQEYSAILNDVIQQAVDQGIVVVASAGNSGEKEYMYPASYSQVISVGSISKNGKVSSFSTYNNKVDVVASGESIISTLPYQNYGIFDGTSFSAPLVSGMAATIKAVNQSRVNTRRN